MLALVEQKWVFWPSSQPFAKHASVFSGGVFPHYLRRTRSILQNLWLMSWESFCWLQQALSQDSVELPKWAVREQTLPNSALGARVILTICVVGKEVSHYTLRMLSSPCRWILTLAMTQRFLLLCVTWEQSITNDVNRHNNPNIVLWACVTPVELLNLVASSRAASLLTLP